MSEMNEIASKHLGQQGSYAISTDTFDASFLVPMPRKLAREDWNIKGDEFVGYDTWHCHEATFLLDNGLPIAGTLKIVYPASSEFMVESKSFKLYLNTFDMCKMGATIKEAIAAYETQVKNDISAAIQAPVEVGFFRPGDEMSELVEEDPAYGYRLLESYIGDEKLEKMKIEDYAAQNPHFKIKEGHSSNFKIFTNVLRSRCRHTKQKDTGAAYFHIITEGGIVDLQSLLEEVIALREVNEFHEFCSEKLFTALTSHPEVKDCVVMLLYSRRGSLDINPVRATRAELIPQALIDAKVYTKKAMGQ